MENHKHLPNAVLFLVFLLIFLNLMIINYFLYKNGTFSAQNKPVTIITTNILPTPAEKIIQPQGKSNICSDSCSDEIKQLKAAMKLSQVVPAQSESNVVSTAVKEYFVAFGTGSVQNTEWTDVPGAVATIDSTNYPQIKTVTFEATPSVPTGVGTAYVRLYNTTDKHPVWFSEISIDGSATKLLTSSPISLDSGSKIYQVQMKNSLYVTTNLNQSRVHITLN